MKREILLTIVMLFCVTGFAQNVRIIDPKIKESDDKVFVSFTLDAENIKSNDRLTLTPVLYGGDKSKKLNPIIITGRNRTITDKRLSVSEGILTTDNQHIPYSLTVPYESWMGDVSLRIERKIESCCSEQVLASYSVVKEKPIRYDVIVPEIEIIKPELSPLEKVDVETPFLAQMEEYELFKNNADVMRAEGALIVWFRQGKNTIDPSFEDNAKSLEQACSVLTLIDAAPNASIGKIVLAGTASPEGSAMLNEQLAQRRVEALQNYLEEHTSININSIESITIGEDWVGLRQMVEQSDMQYKEQVLAIIDNVPVMQGREKQLMDLKWGRPYNYMLEHFFPRLRGAGYIRVFYESKPDLEVEITNQAIQQYNNKEYRDALARLGEIKATATTEYIRGICHMMIGEYDKAQTALTNAIKLGDAGAANQLKKLEKLKAVEQ